MVTQSISLINIFINKLKFLKYFDNLKIDWNGI